ncbi:Uncharacterised protein g6917 [Pycnogonum litorale]
MLCKLCRKSSCWLLLLFVLLTLINNNIVYSKPSSLHDLFLSRTNGDWQDAWHKERIKRCYEDLIDHMEWACRKDIYRFVRRTDPSVAGIKNPFINAEKSSDEDKHRFLSPQEASNILKSARNKRGRRGVSRMKRGIIDECCSSNGCSWEEYAEYCPTNKRLRDNRLHD